MSREREREREYIHIYIYIHDCKVDGSWHHTNVLRLQPIKLIHLDLLGSHLNNIP